MLDAGRPDGRPNEPPVMLAAFWSLALGYVEASPPEGFASWASGSRIAVFRQRSGTTVPTSKIPTERVRVRDQGRLLDPGSPPGVRGLATHPPRLLRSRRPHRQGAGERLPAGRPGGGIGAAGCPEHQERLADNDVHLDAITHLLQSADQQLPASPPLGRVYPGPHTVDCLEQKFWLSIHCSVSCRAMPRSAVLASRDLSISGPLTPYSSASSHWHGRMRGRACARLAADAGLGPSCPRPTDQPQIANSGVLGGGDRVPPLMCGARVTHCDARHGSNRVKRLTAAAQHWLQSVPCPFRRQGGRPCIAITPPRRPFELASKRRRGFPLASPASSAAIESSASTPSSSRSSAGTIHARAVRAAAFRHGFVNLISECYGHPPVLPEDRPLRRCAGQLLRPRRMSSSAVKSVGTAPGNPHRPDALIGCRRPGWGRRALAALLLNAALTRAERW